MRTKFFLTLLALTISAAGLQAQTPAQPAVRPSGAVANAAAAAPVAPAAVNDGDATAKALLQTLQQLKASNDEILQRQTATLSQLDAVSKAAEQMKVFESHR